MQEKTKYLFMRLLKWIGVTFTIFILLSIISAWYFLPLAPLFDDGPFRGVLTEGINDRTPDQVFKIWDENVLEVFDSTRDTNSAIVQLRKPDNTILWAVFADGHYVGDTRSIRFHKAHRGYTRSGTVTGTVDWTYGNEVSYWFITQKGKIRDYWYSW